MWPRRAAVAGWVLGLGCAAVRAPVRESSAGGADGVRVTVRNRSHSDVAGLALRAPGRRAWGPDRLDGDALRAGQDRVFPLDDCAPRDLRLRDDRGAECVLPAVAVCAENDGFTLTADDVLRCERWR